MRAFVRRYESGLLVLGAVSGLAAGLVVVTMGVVAQGLHTLIFGVPLGERLSGLTALDARIALSAPVAGGVILGVLIFIIARWRIRPIVDPIEANALHGGRMSGTDSVIVVIQNLISNGFGASVGLEAGYTQLSSALASKLGITARLRRGDLRLLVGCGSAGAIAAAFNAPLTGSFYAFELIIGSYSISSLAPVVISALTATLVARAFISSGFIIDAGSFTSVVSADYLPALLLGVVCAAGGILLMRGVSLVEEAARRSAVPPVMRPALGGLIVGLLALTTPQVLSGGHGALHLNLGQEVSISILVSLFLLKSIASAVSIGAGFRGGLFFASLFLGALLGKIYALSANLLVSSSALSETTYAIMGMSCLAVAVIGGPLTMTFLALEVTGDFSLTALTLAAVITTSVIVRSTFGYSFATWRFHLRGESIRSAHDVGWIRNLTVDKLMRVDVRTANVKTTVEAFKTTFPLGSTQRVILEGDHGKYAGLVIVSELHTDLTIDPQCSIGDLARHKNAFLLPNMNAKQASAVFDDAESEELAVVNNNIERKVVGLLTESHTLRRYSEELEKRRREISGEI
ncbi:chloride channel protein [Ensifer sp. NPDC090286]|uniref:chloride channel protein n=1 Tax=Ensifer sp. NPDC090286 TaxID=3363991 RepID=UPI00383A2A1A